MSTRPLAAYMPPLHVYRHLLREASYLPPACRGCIAERIRHRFRKHRHDPDAARRLRRAGHDLRYLCAANRGDLERMRRVLLLAFGRTGWRRSELMVALRRPDAPASSAELATALAKTNAAENATGAAPPDWLDKWNTTKLLAFARSQGQRKLHNSPRPDVNPKNVHPDKAVPAANAWGQPLVPKLARLKMRKWWKNLANRIVPPLPRGEWELLRKLAQGTAGPAWAAPPRRAVAQAVETETDADADAETEAQEPSERHGWHWEKYAAHPIRSIERPRSRRFRVISGADQEPLGPYDGPAIGIHRFTPRLWRRLYAEVWRMSAVMEPSTTGKEKSGWSITWGETSSVRLLQPTAASLVHFAGVDHKGRVPLPDSVVAGRTARRPTGRTASEAKKE